MFQDVVVAKENGAHKAAKGKSMGTSKVKGNGRKEQKSIPMS
jgi:hypothetical protein